MTTPGDGQIPEADFHFLREFLLGEIGYELDPDKRYLADCRLAPVAAALGDANVTALLRRLRTGDSSMHNAIIDAMAIQETYFFRSDRAFEVLRRRILPRLQAARGHSRALRVWCAGCATGQEPYSIAMTIAEHFPELEHWHVQILGTDVSDAALRRCREALYSQFEIQRGLPPHILHKYFARIGDHWQPCRRVRDCVEFRKFNLLDPFSVLGGPFDIVSIRNVLIYFNQSLVPRVFDRLRQVIAHDGYLILGESETILGRTDKFMIPTGETDFYAPVPCI